MLTATELWKSFGALDVFADVTFDVGRGERLLVMGLNGAGKTTLLKVLADKLAPDLGEVVLGTHVSVGYYAQEHEGIVPGRTLLEHMREASPVGDGALRNLLGMFGLSGEKVFQDANTLSGGEKTKLALAQLVAGRHNVLLLDEPTNNLDPSSRTATGEALAAWPGTMIVVSHDVEFVRSLAPDPRAADARRHSRLLRRRHAGPARARLSMTRTFNEEIPVLDAPEFHLYLPQMRLTMDAMVEKARGAEAAGFVGMAGMDHLAPPLAEQHDMYEALTTQRVVARAHRPSGAGPARAVRRVPPPRGARA